MLLATIFANACQQHAFGGGLRPYGATILVCGYQDIDDDKRGKTNDGTAGRAFVTRRVGIVKA